jgi:hypothetical protein
MRLDSIGSDDVFDPAVGTPPSPKTSLLSQHGSPAGRGERNSTTGIHAYYYGPCATALVFKWIRLTFTVGVRERARVCEALFNSAVVFPDRPTCLLLSGNHVFG